MRAGSRILATAAAITLTGIASSITRATATPAELDRSLFGHFRHAQIPSGWIGSGNSQPAPILSNVLYSTGFESNESPAYTNGQTISNGTNGWSKTASANAVTTIDNVLPLNGSQDLLWTPATGTPSTTLLYRADTGALWNAYGGNSAWLSANFAFVNPSSGTANRGVFGGLQLYNSANHLIAYDIMLVDPNYATDGLGFTAAYTMETVWDSNNSGAIDNGDDGWDYTFNGIMNLADGLNTYFDMEIRAHTPAIGGYIGFYLNGTELQGAGLSGGVVTTWSGLGDAVNDEGLLTTATGGTTPRIREDDFSVLAFPEPASMGLLSAAALGLSAHRRMRRMG